jgi:hypothetical protein
MLVALVVARRVDAKPALHRAAIPDGARWFCWADSPGACERDTRFCAPFGDGHCEAQDTAWIATGRDPKTRHWQRVAAPTEALCTARARSELAGFTGVSACEEIGATAPLPIDKTLVPPGKGWWCFESRGGGFGLGRRPPGSKMQCVRTKHECRSAHWGITDDKSAVLTVASDKGCVAAPAAYVLTTNDDYQAAPTAADCELNRQRSPDRTACARVE